MANGKTIKLFLVDGTFEGTVEASVHNWSGKGIKVGRDDTDLANEKANLSYPGVYFLFCGGPSDGVYIGESQDVYTRLKQHKTAYNSGSEKFFWTTALCFVDPDLMVKTKYLEARLVDDANAAHVYTILTKASAIPPISAADKSDNETFIEYVKEIVGTLGKPVFTNNTQQAANNPNSVYSYKGKTFDAKMIITGAGFVVLNGSIINPSPNNSMRKGLRELFDDLKAKGIIDANSKLLKDQTFGSISSAASFVSGSSRPGTIDWKDANGTPIGNKTI